MRVWAKNGRKYRAVHVFSTNCKMSAIKQNYIKQHTYLFMVLLSIMD